MDVEVSLRYWSVKDLPLLERTVGDPGMMAFLGGPETPEKIRNRHKRYLTNPDGAGRMFVILVDPGEVPAGTIGYWEREWRGELSWETGWMVLPEFQGKGIATSATEATLREIHLENLHGNVYAYPSVDNPASNAVCRKTGFSFLGEIDFEYPLGHWMRCSEWHLDIRRKFQ